MIDEQFCRYCSDKKVRVFSRMRGDNRIYTDETGAEWSGHRCPDCYTAYKKEYDAKRRKKKGHTPIGTIAICEQCGSQYKFELGCTKKCSLCRGSN